MKYGNLTVGSPELVFFILSPQSLTTTFGAVTLTVTFHRPHKRRHKTHVTCWRHIPIGKQ